jgi:hypothetical protein
MKTSTYLTVSGTSIGLFLEDGYDGNENKRRARWSSRNGQQEMDDAVADLKGSFSRVDLMAKE